MSQERVFIIETDEGRRNYLSKFLADLDCQAEIYPSFSEVDSKLWSTSNCSGILVSDIPFNDAYTKLLRQIKKRCPQLSIIALSNSRKMNLGVELLLEGVIDHLASPDHAAHIFSAIKSELNKRKFISEVKTYSSHLKRLKLSQSKDMRRVAELEDIHNATLENLMTALDLRDVETFGHSLTVAKYSQALAQLLGIKNYAILDNIRRGALLHDIGKIAIPDSILKKPSRLNSEEWEKIKLHPTLGYGLIKEIKLVKEVGNIILCHHERYDGLGYPKGLKKEDIPLEARIFALADALDAITSHRPYRKERDFKAAKKEIQENRGSQFDPKAVDAFCSFNLEKWEKIRYETTKILPPVETFSELLKKE